MNEPKTWRIHWRYHCSVTCVTLQWTTSYDNSHSLLRSQRHGATIVPTRMSKWKFQWHKPRTLAFTKSSCVMSPRDAADLEWSLSEGMQVSGLPPVWIAMIISCWRSSCLNCQVWRLRTFVAQTVAIGEQKVCPESESLKFSTTPTPQVENPSDSSTPTPQPCYQPWYSTDLFTELFSFKIQYFRSLLNES